MGCGYVQPILLDHGGDDETVEHAGDNTVHSSIQVLEEFVSGAAMFPIDIETPVAIDGARGDRREEQQVGEELGRRQRRNQSVLYTEDDVEAAKRHIRDAEEAELHLRRNHWRIL